MMNLNHSILFFLNSFVGRSLVLDGILRILNGNSIFSGGAYFALVWFLWFRNANFRDRVRLGIGVVAAVSAGALGRVVQFSLPFTERPINTSALHLHYEAHLPPGTLGGWSSFPSDHATLTFGLATLIFTRNRRLGLLMFAWAVVVTGARVALGMHYPIDIAGGAVLGIAAVALSQRIPITFKVPASLLRINRRTRAAFYLVAFMLSFEFSIYCADVTALMSIALHKV